MTYPETLILKKHSRVTLEEKKLYFCKYSYFVNIQICIYSYLKNVAAVCNFLFCRNKTYRFNALDPKLVTNFFNYFPKIL